MKYIYLILYSVLCIVGLSVAAVLSTPLSIILIIAATVLLLIIAIQNNFFWNIAIAALSGIIIYGLTFRLPTAVLTVSGPMLASFGIYISYKNKLSLRNTILVGSLGYLMQFIVMFIIFKLIHDTNIVSDFVNDIRDSMMAELYNMPSILSSQGFDLNPANLRFIAKIYNAAFDAILVIAPSLLIIYCGIFSYITVSCVKRILAKQSVFSYFDSFSVFHIPPLLFTLFVFAFIMQSTEMSDLQAAGAFSNLSVLIGFYITVCGLSTIDFFVRKKFKRLWQRLALYIPFAMLMGGMSITLIPLINPMILLFLVGTVDCFFDFRKLRKPLLFE